jgi:membrane-associated PAP2 superfamily phosphatase
MTVTRLAPVLTKAQVVAFGVLLALVVWEAWALDLPMVQLLIQDGQFPLMHHVVLEKWLHDWIKPAIWFVFALLLTQWVRPWGMLADVPRGRIAFAVLSMLLCLFVISWLKKHSLVSCPWELREAGGVAAYVEHTWPWVGWGQSDGGSGKCFPAGHASAGFAWLGLYFALQGFDQRRAFWALIGALSLGLLLGTVQQLRGAHYFSHAPWTGLICWYVCSLAWWLWPEKYKAQAW